MLKEMNAVEMEDTIGGGNIFTETWVAVKKKVVDTIKAVAEVVHIDVAIPTTPAVHTHMECPPTSAPRRDSSDCTVIKDFTKESGYFKIRFGK